ncbi:TPA: replication protein [Escherichia coli]|nr:replication protein [Escherichia coli]HAV9046098.1 replication protein [Escherichia coli]
MASKPPSRNFMKSREVPEPVKQLPVMGGRPLNRAQALAKIAEIKAKFGLKGASV